MSKKQKRSSRKVMANRKRYYVPRYTGPQMIDINLARALARLAGQK